MVQDDETLRGAVMRTDTPKINEVVDSIKADQRDIGRAIAEQLGENATFKSLQEELKARRFSIVNGEEVRAGFDAYRAEKNGNKLNLRLSYNQKCLAVFKSNYAY